MMNASDSDNNSEMASKAEKKLHEILTAADAPQPRSVEFCNWFLLQFKSNDHDEDWCSLESFAIYFLNAVRQRTFRHLRTSDHIDASEESQTVTPLKSLKSIIENANTNNSLDRRRSTSAAITTFPALGTPVKFTHALNRNASTPLRKSAGALNSPQQSSQHTQQPQQHQNKRRSIDNIGRNISTTHNSSSFEKTRNSTGNSSHMASSSFCLGDFLSSPPTNNRSSSFQKKKSNANTPPNTTPGNASNSKPKKRVIPISVSKTSTLSFNDTTPFGINSSFSADNNILTIGLTEIECSNKRAIAEARKALKKDLTEVSSVLKSSTPTTTPTKINTRSSSTDLIIPAIQLHEVRNTKNLGSEIVLLGEPINFDGLPKEILVTLQQFSTIYALLLDMNFVLNILNEISFLLNLLNANVNSAVSQNEFQNRNISGSKIDILAEAINSVYFAMCVLEHYEQTLSLMDVKSLGVVLQCERLIGTSEKLKSSLTKVCEQKQTISTSAANDMFFSGLKNVCFQEDSNSRKFFPSTLEFSAFKTQRDLFYTTLKIWEKHHLHPSWNFAIEVAPKVREIFRQSENPINMTHFATLFVSQLLVSANEQTSPEDIGIGNEDIDLQKFNKLTQRLIAPSNFSVDYQFPREQAFFRDFIVESRSVSFIEHLKMMLYSELITLNDSTFEQLNLLTEEGGDPDEHEDSEFIVRPAVLASMLILAKFLGFVTALPFQYPPGSTEAGAAIIQSYQLRLRGLFQSPINIFEILDTAMQNRHHLITIPWLVQYMAMLDDVTLQLPHFTVVIEKLFALYISLGNGQVQLMPISQFVVRCCLGWLFEQKPFIAAEYYVYRATHKTVISNRCPQVKSKSTDFKPILESFLCVACPFLAEFRVSIMPAKHALTKYVSRSGRYRHITPCLAELPKINENTTKTVSRDGVTQRAESPTASAAQKVQKKLMESFMHAQNTSMRRLIVFLTERVYKCVVKEAQHRILLPSKSTADGYVNDITSCDRKEVYSQVISIYQTARNDALKQWDLLIPDMINERTMQGLDALLPVETVPIIKQTYARRIKSDANTKIQQWRHMNLFKNSFYCNDPLELTEKLCKSNMNRTKQINGHTTEMKLIKSVPSISDLIEEIQHWLYTTGSITSYRPEQSAIHLDQKETNTEENLIDFLRRLTSSFENTLPTIYYRLIGSGLVQILQHLITTTPQYVTPKLIKAVCEFFTNENIRAADIATTPFKTLNLNADALPNESSNTTTLVTQEATTIYHALITAPFIESLGNCQMRYEKLRDLLTSMIQRGVITLDFVNELFVAIFKEDLRPCVFNEISRLLNEIAQEINRNVGGSTLSTVSTDSDSEDGRKSQLFMEVLADLSRDLDEF